MIRMRSTRRHGCTAARPTVSTRTSRAHDRNDSATIDSLGLVGAAPQVSSLRRTTSTTRTAPKAAWTWQAQMAPSTYNYLVLVVQEGEGREYVQEGENDNDEGT